MIMAGPNVSVDLTVITATWQRPERLVKTIAAVAAQEAGPLRVEHLVVSDGADPNARAIATGAGVAYAECEHNGFWGAAAKDRGIELARGHYVCFFDDDNSYELHAIAALWRTAYGEDIGVVQCKHHDRKLKTTRLVPSAWNGAFVYEEIDTMCVCVRRTTAAKARWAAHRKRGTDFAWLTALEREGASIRFRPVVIGDHL
jgi:glycosyltransferase involved in cell wall biosynthesis